MKLLSLVAGLSVAVAGTLWASAGASADSASSDAAHMCLQGPQVDYYEVVGSAEKFAPDFGDLTNGSDEKGAFIVAANHGECVSFVAKNSKGKGSEKPAEQIKIVFTDVLVRYR